jgi:hypothetical protein
MRISRTRLVPKKTCVMLHGLTDPMDAANANSTLDPSLADTAPTDGIMTGYDEQHLVTYLRLLDAEKDGADWQEVANVVLHIDPAREPIRAQRARM